MAGANGDMAGGNSGGDGGSGNHQDGGVKNSDLGTGATGDMAGGGGGGLPCSPGSYRCGVANSIEICNSTGTAWLHSATCAVSCSGGLCTGACTPGAKRCNAKDVEQCNAAGTAWTTVDTCTGSCSSGTCALATLDITMNQALEGEIFVDGDVFIRSGVTVSSLTGNLTIHAQNITVENMGSLSAAAPGNPSGQGAGGVPTVEDYYSGGGGGNGTVGNGGVGSGGGSTIGSDTDAQVTVGGNGGSGYPGIGGAGGNGGGVIRLLAASNLTVAGFVTATGGNGGGYAAIPGGGGGGGGGGGILLAAGGDITVSGAVVTSGGIGGNGYDYNGGNGGLGRAKILAGGTRTISGTITAQETTGLLPPILITSSSHPDPTLIYNDNFDSIDLSWVRPFSALQGYYQLIDTNTYNVPTPANASFVNTESTSYPPSAVVAGINYFHVTPVDAMSEVGTIENTFIIRINSTPPSVNSSSHPSGSWTNNPNVFLSWSLPVADNNVQGVYYVFDHYGTTVPTTSATFVPLPQKTQLISSVASGIWVMHVVAMDQRGYLTKQAGHYRVQVGTDPGNGVVLGLVTDSMGMPISGATVSINRGLWSQTSNSSGNFNFPSVSAGSYELEVSAPGKMPATQNITVTMGNSTTANVSLP